MTDISGNSTDRKPGDTSPDTYRVLLRGRIRIEAEDYSLGGSWYSAVKSVDLGQYNFEVLPMVEAYVSDGGSTIKMPVTTLNGTGTTVTGNYYFDLTAGTKFDALSTNVRFFAGNTSGGAVDIYYQIMSLPAGGELFP